jgi:hypothetical protein
LGLQHRRCFESVDCFYFGAEAVRATVYFDAQHTSGCAVPAYPRSLNASLHPSGPTQSHHGSVRNALFLGRHGKQSFLFNLSIEHVP